MQAESRLLGHGNRKDEHQLEVDYKEKNTTVNGTTVEYRKKANILLASVIIRTINTFHT